MKIILDKGLSLKETGIFATYSQKITDADVKSLAGLSGDNNPNHMNGEHAIESREQNELLTACFLLRSSLLYSELNYLGQVAYTFIKI